MRRLNKRNAEIVAMVRDTNLTLSQIGNRYGLSRTMVRRIAKASGVVRVSRYNALPEDKIAVALAWQGKGMSMTHAAETAGLNPDSLRKNLISRGLRSPINDMTQWTAAEERFLRRRYKQPKWSALRIADHLGRTRNEVIGKANRLGLGSVAKARAAA